jgi:hypothetical protein
MKLSIRLSRLALGITAASALALVGCESSNEVSHSDITSDLTPELMTLNERPVDVGDARATTFNSNWRAMWGDINRALLLDRPSRLAPLPIAH